MQACQIEEVRAGDMPGFVLRAGLSPGTGQVQRCVEHCEVRRVQFARMSEAFDKYDADLDGKVTREEFDQIWDDEEMRPLVFGAGERRVESVDALFKELDVDVSGALSRIEFLSLALLARRPKPDVECEEIDDDDDL